ncbi:MAG: MarR family transcriptional regulator [Clostridiales bacterium]|nr:MarR family transcriptional regulator [Clostridiales bacterium]
MDRSTKIKSIIETGNSTIPLLRAEASAAYDKQMTTLQFITINILKFDSNQNGMTMKMLASSLGISKQQATALIDSIVKLGYIDRFDNPNNRREVIVKLSDDGRKKYEEMIANQIQKTSEKYDVFSDDELDDLQNCMNTIKNLYSRLIN